MTPYLCPLLILAFEGSSEGPEQDRQVLHYVFPRALIWPATYNVNLLIKESIMWDALVIVMDVVAKTAGIVSGAVDLATFANWNKLSDNHPLYATDNASPKLDITATATSFNFLIKQPNEIGETVDDKPVTLKGTAYINPTGTGDIRAWEYDITFTYEKNFDAFDTLTANGIVKHVYSPHPEDGDQMNGVAININNTLVGTRRPFPDPPQFITQPKLSPVVDHPAAHFDLNTINILGATCCTKTLGNFTQWEYQFTAVHAKEVHDVPGPLSILGVGAFLRYSRKLRKRIKSSKPEVISTTVV
jgi:hypothetical protein